MLAVYLLTLKVLREIEGMKEGFSLTDFQANHIQLLFLQGAKLIDERQTAGKE